MLIGKVSNLFSEASKFYAISYLKICIVLVDLPTIYTRNLSKINCVKYFFITFQKIVSNLPFTKLKYFTTCLNWF